MPTNTTEQSEKEVPEQSSQADQASNVKPGAAGVLCATFIHSPLSPLLYIVMLILGVYGLMATPRQEDPEISVPMIDIFYLMP